MTFFGLVILAVLLWVGIGGLLLYLGSKPCGHAYRRSLNRHICTLGEEVEVTLRHVPPSTPQLAGEQDVVVALDHSGSMGSAAGSPLREATRAAENFIRRLPESIHVSVIAFDHEAKLLCDITDNHRKALRAIGSIGPGGGTEIHLALEQCLGVLDTGRPDVPKAVILFSDGGSDPQRAKAAAANLRAHPSQPQIVCAGFGVHADEALLREIASDDGAYLHVQETGDLETLFEVLAGVVTGQTPIAGLIDEEACAPRPFEFSRTSGLYPISVEPAETTHIYWPAPVLGQELRPVSYTLATACVGWRPVATSESSVTWRMPDGNVDRVSAPAGPRVLVMPRLLGWAWPVLNPLFWLLIQSLLKCVAPAADAEVSVAPPLSQLTLPDRPSAPEAVAFTPQLRTALIIGLGLSGESILCTLKYRLWDRGVENANVSLVNVQLGHPENRQLVRVGDIGLSEHERCILQEDFRPYLETMRRQGLPVTRAWIPMHQWLARTQPLTTAQGAEGDRRLARLALLRQGKPLETRIADFAHRVEGEERFVVIVGAAEDAEASGLLGEVAHMCAAADLSVTAVLTPAQRSDDEDPKLMGLAQELERMMLMRGDAILSDRQEPPVLARQLFDRIVIAGETHADAEENDLVAAESVWALLGYPEVLEQMPVMRGTRCYRLYYQGRSLPQEALWQWARERLLLNALNQQWLRLTENVDSLLLPPLDERVVQQHVNTFWSAQGLTCLQSALLRTSFNIFHKDQALLSMLEGAAELPTNKPYHEQKVFCERHQQLFAFYVAEWCQAILDSTYHKKQWPIPLLLQAITLIQADFGRLSYKINQLSGNNDFVNFTQFASSLSTEYQLILGALRRDVEQWHRIFVKTQTAAEFDGLPFEAISIVLKANYEQAERNLIRTSDRNRELIESAFQQWLPHHRDILLNQLHFQVVMNSHASHVGLNLQLAEHLLKPHENILAKIKDFLRGYQTSVFQWPSETWMEPTSMTEPESNSLIGKKAHEMFPTVNHVITDHDPFIAAAIRIDEQDLSNALQLRGVRPETIIYVWPEEANAVRIAAKIQNILERDPEPFTPRMVSLMRDTAKLYAFFADLANGHIILQEHRILLERSGRRFEIGLIDEDLSLEMFEAVVRQVVTLGVSLDGAPLPSSQEPWVVSTADALQMVENQPLTSKARLSPEWAAWQDVICGLALEHGISYRVVS